MAEKEITAAMRKVTNRIRRRAWLHPYVRFWWLMAIVLAAIAGAITFGASADWNHERWLINHGVVVRAVVQQAADQTLAGRPQPPDAICILQFDWHGQAYTTRPDRLAGRNAFVAPKDAVTIYVNPADPSDWTSRSHPGPLLPRLLGAAVAFAAALAALLVSILYYLRTLRSWRNAPVVDAMVLETHTTAIAPLCIAVTCTSIDENDKRLFTVFVPRRTRTLQPGDPIPVLTSLGKSAGALALAWFE